MSLSEKRKELEEKAEIWDSGHEEGFWNGRLSSGESEAVTGVEHAKIANPYRKLLKEIETTPPNLERDELIRTLVTSGIPAGDAQAHADAVLEAGFGKLAE